VARTTGDLQGSDDQLTAAATLLVLLVVLAVVAGGVGGVLTALGLAALAVGGYAGVRGRVPGVRVVRRRTAAVVLGAGLVLACSGGVLAPDTRTTASEAAAPGGPAPEATTPAPVAQLAAPASTNPAPELAMTCPIGGSVASPDFGRQITATAPYSITIDYGDGDRYTDDDRHLDAVFTHTYTAGGSFTVNAVLTDATGRTASAACMYTWAKPSRR
jgi:hypothetical protein